MGRGRRMRILIADSQTSVRSALKMLLTQGPDFSVVAEASDSQELLRQMESARPDVVLLDWELPGQRIEEILSALYELDPQPHVVILCSRPEMRSVALAAGANAFVSKADPPSRLLTALRVIRLESS